MTDSILLVIFLVFSFLQVILLFVILIRGQSSKKSLSSEDQSARSRFEQNERVIREEISRNREESTRQFTQFATFLDKKLSGVQDSLATSAKYGREDLARSLSSFEGRMDAVRLSVEQKLTAIQADNNSKLEKIRETVDEKLHKTLETRLGESFKLVSDRLELVQKGLGEMQSLATGVGDLKKVLSNVKTRGVMGEYQLQRILEQLLTRTQYDTNVKTKKGSQDIVEFAVRIPSKNLGTADIWLPIDAKFPSEDYVRLMSAYEANNITEIDIQTKNLRTRILQFARDISSKYLDPPGTTDFGIMFLPFEGLYAEVLRIPELFETVQREYKITITGPTTISAFLSSLQMGFHSLAVEKRTSEIWELLGSVKKEFGKFGEVLEKTKERIDAASKELDNAGIRSRAIERRLQNVQELPDIT